MKKIITGAIALLLMITAVSAQTRDSIRHQKGKHDFEVTHVNLSEEQRVKLKSIREAQRTEIQAIKNSSMTPVEQKAKKAELHTKYKEQLQSVYTPEQKAQIQKVKKERKANGDKGGMSKSRKHNGSDKKAANYSKQLQLNELQKEKMAVLRKENKIKATSIRNDKSLTSEQKKSGLKDLRKQHHEQLTSLLNPEQLKKMKTIRKDRSHKNTK